MLNKFFKRAKTSKFTEMAKVGDSVSIALSHLPHSLYTSKIVAIGNRCLSLSFPTQNGSKLPLQKKSKLNVSVTTAKGHITFASKVKRYSNKAQKLLIKLPDKFQLNQRRQYARVSVRIQVTLATSADRRHFQASLMDLSGGGCLLYATDIKDIKVGEELIIDFSNTPVGLQQIMATVIRINKNETVALQFQLQEKEREKIIFYVHKRQIELQRAIRKAPQIISSR